MPDSVFGVFAMPDSDTEFPRVCHVCGEFATHFAIVGARDDQGKPAVALVTVCPSDAQEMQARVVDE